MYEGHILDVPGISIGHAQDEAARTGVTVLLPGAGAIGGADVRGGAPGTRETDLLRPENTVSEVHAVVLSGGSAFGLDASTGVMRYLEERGVGFQTAFGKVPIVCQAVLYDLGVGDAKIRPDAAMGYLAASNAGQDVRQGAIGAGCGATCGKMVPGAVPARGGIGSASVRLPGGAVVGAVVAVNALGDVYDPRSGAVVACGMLRGAPVTALDAVLGGGAAEVPLGQNTSIGAVATNARLTKAQCAALARSAHDGLALAIRPAHTGADGDSLFALSVGDVACEFILLQMAAAEAVARAAVNAVLAVRGR